MSTGNPQTTHPAMQYWLQPSMHPTYARLLCAYLRREGFDWQQILSGTQLSWERLESDYQYLSLAQVARLVTRARHLTGRTWLGYEVGRITTISTHGVFGHTALCAPDIRSLLEVITRFVRIRFSFIGIPVESEGDNCVVRIDELQPWGNAREFVLLIVLATIMQLLDTAAAEPITPLRIDWPLPAPDPPIFVERLAGVQTCYNTPRFGLHIPPAALDQRCMMADPGNYRNGLRDCEAQLHHQLQGGTTSMRVYNLLLGKAPHYPQLEDAASALATSRRTLMRRLKVEGSSYQTLMDNVRQELTAWYLLESDLPIAHVAEHVGYEDTSNFARSVRRWFGITPLAMRQANAGDRQSSLE